MINIGNKKIGDGMPCFITFEAGPTHNGLASAKRLAEHAANAGADAIKFQIFDPDRLVSDKKLLFTYQVLVDKKSEKTETVSEPLYDIMCRRALRKDEWKSLKKYCDSLGLVFFATVGFEDEIELVEELNCDSIKIASADVNHIPLLKRAARSGLCIQLDTGNSTIGEIEAAVDVICAEGNNNIIIHQCPSGYPARLESINLNIIQTLKRMFNFPVAFSDHSPGWDMDVAAVSLGANLLEKTISEDRTTRSVEHIMSLEPKDMTKFIKVIREVETAFGHNRRVMSDEEQVKRHTYRRSVHLNKAVRAGDILTKDIIEFRRPGFGIQPDQFQEFIGRKIKRNLSSGEMLSFEDFID